MANRKKSSGIVFLLRAGLEQAAGGEDGAHLGGEGGGGLGSGLGEVIAGGGVDDAAGGVDKEADFVDEAVLAHFFETAALGAYAGDEEEAAGGGTAHLADEFTAGGANDEHGVDGCAPFLHAFHHVFEQRCIVFVFNHLEVEGAFIGSKSEHHGPFVLKFEEWFYGVFAHVGSDGDGVDTHLIEECASVHTGGVAYVAAFSVGNDELVRIVLSDVLTSLLEGTEAVGAERFVEGQVGFVGHGVGGGGIDYGFVELEQALGTFFGEVFWHFGLVGVEANAEERATREDVFD